VIKAEADRFSNFDQRRTEVCAISNYGRKVIPGLPFRRPHASSKRSSRQLQEKYRTEVWAPVGSALHRVLEKVDLPIARSYCPLTRIAKEESIQQTPMNWKRLGGTLYSPLFERVRKQRTFTGSVRIH